MKNINLNFIYLTVAVGDVQKQYTFVSPNSDAIKEALNNQFNNSLFPEINITIDREVEYKISYKKDQKFYKLCQDKFTTVDYVKYDSIMSFDADIDTHSFKSDLLMDNEQYEASSPLEVFLKEHNILKSYYRHEVDFKIKAQTHEYSRDLGQKKFENTYHTKQIDMDILNNNKTNIHDSHVYTSYTIKQLVQITGLDDAGKKINKDFSNMLSVKAVNKQFSHNDMY